MRTDPSRVLPEFKEAYLWMAARLRDKTPPPSGLELPIWAWWRAHGRTKPRPDLRRSWGERGERLALVEFDMPEDQVLLSDYQTWHFPLNRWPLHNDALEEEMFERRLEAADAARAWPYPEPFAAEVERSWEKIFRWDRFDPSYHEPEETMQIQAVVWEIAPDSVRSIRSFISR